MRKNIFVLFILLFLSGFSTVNAMNIQYALKMPKPQNHYFEVEMLIEDYKAAALEVKMPVWAPGSYLLREFAKNVNLVKAFDEKGNALTVQKTNKNTWKIQKGNAKSVKVKYEVYSFELSVRTSFLDLTHGYVSGSGVFMYVENQQENKGKLIIYPYSGFKKISTALPKAKEGMASDGAETFEFSNYDQLVDCPIEIGNHIEFSFQSADVNHRVAMYGDGNFDVEQLKKDMAKITATATQVIGENPNKEYLFIIHNVVDGQGGLEHINSTTLSVNRWTYQGGEYIGFLSLVAHEYFHLWNVKRIRPIELGPFNYDEENYTSMLWVMEGFTSYYDELLLLRAGYYTQEQYIQKVLSGLNYVEGSEGSRVQPLAHASFDAWIKSYRPNENSANTTMTYYSRGGLLAAVLDAKIVAKFNGKKCLDDFLKKLYQDFYKKLNRGFSEAEFQKALSDFMEEDMSVFFRDYVNDTKVPDYKSIFAPVGLKVEYIGNAKPSFGASFSQSNGKAIVKGIRVNSAAENAGLSVNDEVIGYNGYRVEAGDLDGIFAGLTPGESINLLISRDDVLLEIKAIMGSHERPTYKMTFDNNEKTLKLRNYWLR
jgi:predicted metalloprotease with PDZ domain